MGEGDIISNRFEKSSLFIDRAKGSKLIDKEGNEYIDYNLGNYTQVLGHSHTAVIKAIEEQAKKGVNYEQKTELLYETAKKILKYSKMNQLRFLNSGSEAVNLALKLARGYTSKRYIVKFSGHFHGWLGEEIYKFTPAFQYLGIPEEYSKYTISIPWNDKIMLDEIFEKHGDKIAAVICEPVAAHSGVIPPFNNFLRDIRDITKRNSSLFIMDEIVTGFRLAFGGAQEVFDVDADIVTYSKTINAGLPLSVVAGKKEIMHLLNDWKIYQAGTCDANQVCLAACNAVIDEIVKNKIPAKLEITGKKLMKGLQNSLDSLNINALVQGYGSFFQTFFTDEEIIKNHRDAVTKTDVKKLFGFINELLQEKVYVFDGSYHENPNYTWIGSWRTSAAHTDDDITKTIMAAEKILKKI